MTGTLIESARGAGISVVEEGSTLLVSDSTVRWTKLDFNGLSGVGARVRDGSITIEDSLLDENHSSAVLAEEGSKIELHRMSLRRTHADEAGDLGIGLTAYDGAAVVINHCVLEENNENGVIATGPETRVELERCVIRNTSDNAQGEFGYGVQVSDGATLILRAGLLEGNTGDGVVVAEAGTTAQIVGTIIRDTVPSGTGIPGRGVEVLAGAEVALNRAVITGARTEGVFLAHEGSRASIDHSVIRGILTDQGGTYGCGVSASDGTTVTMNASLVEENRSVGVMIEGTGADATIKGTVIRDTLPDDTGYSPGRGIQAGLGCHVLLSESLVDGNREIGVLIGFPETRVELVDSIVRATKTSPDGSLGEGVRVIKGGSASLLGCLLEENHDAGLACMDDGTMVTLDDCLVRETMAPEDYMAGIGLWITGGCHAEVSRTRVEGNAGLGIGVSGFAGDDTALLLTNSIIAETLLDTEGLGGRAIEAGTHCDVQIRDSLIARNREIALAVGGSGATLEMERVTIRDTLPSGLEASGRGVEISDGASASFRETVIERNRIFGIGVYGPGTRLSMSRSIVRSILPGEDESGGQGIHLQEGGGAKIEDCLIEDNVRTGISVFDPGSMLTMTGSTVRTAGENEEDTLGRGLNVVEGGTAALSGCLLEDNLETAAFVASPQTRFTFAGGIIRGNGRSGYDDGHGLYTSLGAEVALSWTLVDGNHTNGILCFGDADMNPGDERTEVVITDSAIRGTRGGEQVMPGGEMLYFGDGLFVWGDAADLTLDRSIVSDNDRAGAYFFDHAAGALTMSVFTGNGCFGLVLENCEETVDFTGGDLFVIGNSLNLPPSRAEEITTNPGGLPLPDPLDDLGESFSSL